MRKCGLANLHVQCVQTTFESKGLLNLAHERSQLIPGSGILDFVLQRINLLNSCFDIPKHQGMQLPLPAKQPISPSLQIHEQRSLLPRKNGLWIMLDGSCPSHLRTKGPCLTKNLKNVAT